MNNSNDKNGSLDPINPGLPAVITISKELINSLIPQYNESSAKFPIVGIGLPYGWSYFTESVASLYSQSGCNMAQNTMGATDLIPELNSSTLLNPTILFNNSYLKYILSLRLERFNEDNDPDGELGNNFEVKYRNLFKNIMASQYFLVKENPHCYQFVRIGFVNNKKEMKEKWEDMVKFFSEWNGIFAWKIVDEPSIKSFPTIQSIEEICHDIDSSRPTFVNLLPINATDYQLYVDTTGENIGIKGNLQIYQNYLNRFQIECNPDLWSTDMYAFSLSGNEYHLRNGYFENLLALRNASIMSGKPFWWYVYSQGNPALLKENLMQFAAMTAIAFGAKGLAFWRMVFAPQGEDTKTGDEAPIEPTPKSYDTNPPTPTGIEKNGTIYPNVAKVISRIRGYEDLFVNGVVTDIRFFKPTSSAYLSMYEDVKAFDCLAPYSSTFCEYMTSLSSAVPLLLSKIVKGGRTYILMLNIEFKKESLTNSDAISNCTVKFSREVNILTSNSDLANTTPDPLGNSTSLSDTQRLGVYLKMVLLKPSQFVIFELT